MARSSALTICILASLASGASAAACVCAESWVDDSGDCQLHGLNQHSCPTLAELRRCDKGTSYRWCKTTEKTCDQQEGDMVGTQRMALCDVTDPAEREKYAQEYHGSFCKLSKIENGKTVHYDLSILEKPFQEGKTFREANYVVHVSGYARNQDDDGVLVKMDPKMIYMNVCGPLANVASVKGNRSMAAVVEENMNKMGHGVHTIGSVNNAHIYSLMDNDLRMVLPGGEATSWDPGCQERISSIAFLCADVGIGSPVFFEETAKCRYLFIWATCAACPVGSAERDLCATGSFGAAHGLSAGPPAFTIFVAVMAFLAIIYLTGGIFYMRVAHGAKGWDQLPNRSFWSSLCGLPAAMCSGLCGLARMRPAMSKVSYQTHTGLIEEGEDDLDDDAEDQYD